MRNHHDSSWPIIIYHDDTSWWWIIMTHYDESSWFIATNHDGPLRSINMNHDDAALWSAVQPWTDSVQGCIVFFCDGCHHCHDIFQGVLLPWPPFCHGSHGMSHAFSPWLPWHFPMPWPSKWKSKIARVQHTHWVHFPGTLLWNRFIVLEHQLRYFNVFFGEMV